MRERMGEDGRKTKEDGWGIKSREKEEGMIGEIMGGEMGWKEEE